MWCDSHCHLSYDGVGAEGVVAARAAGVTRLVTVGTDEAHSRAGIELASVTEGVWATAGLHPHEAVQGLSGVERVVAEKSPVLVAVGECGLDYHYDHSPRPVQREAFAAQVRLAGEHGLALVVHTREAWDDTFDILRAEGVPARWVLHCFTGGPDEVRRGLDLGAHVSFSGIITFKNAGDVRAAAALCPLDRVLVETDSPYLAPVPHRGEANRPALVPVVGVALASAMGVTASAVEDSTWSNAAEVFALGTT